MTSEQGTHPVTLSHRGLAVATAASLVVAALGLTLVVLPSAYGIDPTGVGQALDLLPPPELPQDLFTVEEDLVVVLDPGRSTTRSHALTEGQLLEITWSSTVPINFTLQGASGPAAQAGTLAATNGPTDFFATTVEVPSEGYYRFTWENPNTTRAEATLSLALGHGGGSSP